MSATTSNSSFYTVLTLSPGFIARILRLFSNQKQEFPYENPGSTPLTYPVRPP